MTMLLPSLWEAFVLKIFLQWLFGPRHCLPFSSWMALSTHPTKRIFLGSLFFFFQSEALSGLKRVQFLLSYAAADGFFQVFSLPSLKESIESIFVIEVSLDHELNITTLDGCVALKKLFLSAISILPGKPTLARHDAVALRSTSIELLSLDGFDLSRRGFLPSLVSSDHGVSSVHKSLEAFDFQSTTLSAKDCLLLASSWKTFPFLSTLEVVLDAVDESSSAMAGGQDHIYIEGEEVDDEPLESLAVPRGNPEVVMAFVRGVLDCESILQVNEELLNLSRREIQHHLKMNEVGRRIIYSAPSDASLLGILPKLFERASMVYPLDGIYSLLRDDLDLAKVFGSAEATSKKTE